MTQLRWKSLMLTCILSDPLHALAGELSQIAVQGELVVKDFISLDLNVCCLPLCSSQRLMDHDSGTWQRIPLALQQASSNAQRCAEAAIQLYGGCKCGRPCVVQPHQNEHIHA